jgi:hypothetical protein
VFLTDIDVEIYRRKQHNRRKTVQSEKNNQMQRKTEEIICEKLKINVVCEKKNFAS